MFEIEGFSQNKLEDSKTFYNQARKIILFKGFWTSQLPERPVQSQGGICEIQNSFRRQEGVACIRYLISGKHFIGEA